MVQFSTQSLSVVKACGQASGVEVLRLSLVACFCRDLNRGNGSFEGKALPASVV